MPPVNKQTMRPSIPMNRSSQNLSVLDRISPIGNDDKGIKVLLYGQSGSGKTTLWATFPGPILAILCSGGMKNPGETRSIDTPEYRKKISKVTVNSTEEFRQLMNHCARGQYQTVVLDHVSGFQDLILKEVLGLDELPAQKSWGMASQQLYGQCAGACKDMLRMILNLTCNVVIVGQERVSGGEEAGTSDIIRPTVGVAVIPSIAGWLNPACDYVMQMYKRPVITKQVRKIGKEEIETETRGKGVEYCARTEPHEVFATKFRVPRGRPLPECIVDPSYEKIIHLIKGES